MENILEINNLCKNYEDFSLKDVSFSLPKGYIMGFVGQNGSGKTTTIRSILNMAHKDSGKISVFGLDSVDDSVKIKERLGVVFDSLYLADHLTPKQIEKQLKPFYENWDSKEYARLIKEFGLPEGLKLSIHSGSDKFSIYPIMGRLIRQYDKGIHIKTAGTTWLEENIGLALADDQALELAKKIAISALGRMEELCGPYATVIDINPANLPTAEQIASWDGSQYARALRHNRQDPLYNPDFRQLVHVSYKIAAELAPEFYAALERNADVVAEQVKENILERHIARLF